jgi:hypothetical protein
LPFGAGNSRRDATELQQFRSIGDLGLSIARSFSRSAKWSSAAMRQKIEHLFEVIEANAACAVVSIATSFALTGCLHLLWG